MQEYDWSADILVRFDNVGKPRADKNVRAPEQYEMRTIARRWAQDLSAEKELEGRLPDGQPEELERLVRRCRHLKRHNTAGFAVGGPDHGPLLKVGRRLHVVDRAGLPLETELRNYSAAIRLKDTQTQAGGLRWPPGYGRLVGDIV